MDGTLSSFPCPTLFTEGYGTNSDEMKEAYDQMQVELVVSEIIRTIEIKELGLADTMNGVRRRLFQEGPSTISAWFPSGVPASNPPPVPQYDAQCNRCGHNRFTIEGRGNGMDFLEYRCMGHSVDGPPELICQSCCYEGGVECIDCGMSEHFALNQGLPRFMENTEVWPRNWRCDGCWARKERYELELEGQWSDSEMDDLRRRESQVYDLLECGHCGRVWDGNAQCPCLLLNDEEEEEPTTPRSAGQAWAEAAADDMRRRTGLPPAEASENEDDPAVREIMIRNHSLRIRDEVLDQRVAQRLIYLLPEEEEFEDDETYIGEYENEDWQPENNSEKVKEIKDKVKEIGEIVYDIQEKISEGEYLKLMDSLQGLTNRVNEL